MDSMMGILISNELMVFMEKSHLQALMGTKGGTLVRVTSMGFIE